MNENEIQQQAGNEPGTRQVRLKVKYDDVKVLFASQAIMNTTPEEIFLEFSSGVITDPSSGDSVLPIQTRIAMTHAGAARLSAALQQALAKISAPRSGVPRIEPGR